MRPKQITSAKHFLDLWNGGHKEKSWSKQTPAVSNRIWIELIEQGDEIAFAVAQNITLDREILTFLAHHRHRSVRQSIAEKKKLMEYPELFEVFSKDEDEGVRVSCFHRDTPDDIRRWMEETYGYSLE